MANEIASPLIQSWDRAGTGAANDQWLPLHRSFSKQLHAQAQTHDQTSQWRAFYATQARSRKYDTVANI